MLVNFVMLGLYLAILIYYKYKPFFNMEISKIWFPLLCFFLSFILYFKWLILGSEGVLWLAVTLNVTTISFVVYYIFNLTIIQFIPFVISAFYFAFLVIGLVCSDFLALKISNNLIFPIISTFLFCFNVVQIFLFVVLLVISIILNKILNSFFTCLFIIKRKK